MPDPSPRLAMVGSGKLAQNIGMSFLKAGWRVDWLTRSGARLESAAPELKRQVRRQQLVAGNGDLAENWSLGLLTDYSGHPDLVIESSSEDLPQKRAIAATMDQKIPDRVPRLSNSSSILPSEIGPNWLGCHFFYPVELSGFVEFIVPEGSAGSSVADAEAFLMRQKLHIIHQSEFNAFAVNRLLLPVQALAMRALLAGQDATIVEAASQTEQHSAGVLSTMDSIGLDLVLSAVQNYAARASADWEIQACASIIQGLAPLLSLGKRGTKSGDGLLKGTPLPWKPAISGAAMDSSQFDRVWREALATIAESGMIAEKDLAFLVRNYWGG